MPLDKVASSLLCSTFSSRTTTRQFNESQVFFLFNAGVFIKNLIFKFSLFLFSFFLLGIFNILLKYFLLNSCTFFKVKSSQHSLEAVAVLCLAVEITLQVLLAPYR